MKAKEKTGLPTVGNRDLPYDNTASSHVVFLRRKVVEKRTGLPRSSIYAAIARNEFPKPVAIGAKSVAWVESEVVAWMQDKLKNRA